MKTSQLLLATLKETPADAEIVSHQLMLRAGMIRKLASGLYNWLPLGIRVVRRIEAIIREELAKVDAQEVLMPVVQPAELWQESGRWQQYGPELLRLSDRHQREFCLGPTHEEVITDLVRQNIHSYKQLPVAFYQIQTKFRDEIRPRFGVMRAREFIMKDAYSFHLDQDSLDDYYERMYHCYSHILDRMGLRYKAVLADTGSIGGNASHEFHVLADSGEDEIAFSDGSDYAANVELAPAICKQSRPAPSMALEKIHTPAQHQIDQVCQFLQIPARQTIKTLLVKATQEAPHELIALAIRGDQQLNEIKAEKLDMVASPLCFASDEEIYATLACHAGSIGVVDLTIPLFVDHSAASVADFVCGANQDDYHYQGVNWDRDVKEYQPCDLRKVTDGDPAPDGQGTLQIKRGIEVGHIFKLGQKYSQALNASILNADGKSRVMTMGCYGIGVTRLVAATIEQNHDQAGIIWPASIAPFQLAIIPMNYHKSARVRKFCAQLYQQCREMGIDVLLDDRKERAGVLFADMELIGIPFSLVVGERGLDKQYIEFRNRANKSQNQNIAIDKITASLKDLIS